MPVILLICNSKYLHSFDLGVVPATDLRKCISVVSGLLLFPVISHIFDICERIGLLATVHVCYINCK
jgi:hypothetical protein